MNIKSERLFSAQLIAIAVFAVSNLSFLTNGTFPGTYSFEIGNIRTLIDIGRNCDSVCASRTSIEALRVKMELEAEVECQLKTSMCSISSPEKALTQVNCKYHDLKHQIASTQK